MLKKIVFPFFLLLTITIFAQEVPQIPTAASLPVREANPATVYPVSVEYPQEGMTLPAGIKQVFVFGAAANPKAALTVNGAPAKLYKTGGFLTTVPVTPGDMSVTVQTTDASGVYTAVRKFKVSGADVSTFAAAQFDITSLFPQTDIWALEGDVMLLSAAGTPGAEVTATIDDIKAAKDIPLQEVEPGLYKSTYTITAGDKAKDSKIIYKITNPQTKDKAKESAPGRLKILTDKDQFFAVPREPGSRMRLMAVPQGYMLPFYRLYGTLEITGLFNGLYRIKLDENNAGWLEDYKLNFVKSPDPLNKITTITTADLGVKTRIIFFNAAPAPTLIDGSAAEFGVTFFNTSPDVPIIETPVSPLVRDITFEQLGPKTVKFHINYNEGQILWGYDYAYDEKGNLILDLIHKPAMNPQPYKPLTGIKIMLDPGHSPGRKPPYDGAIGPTGLLEYEANMKTAQDVAALLAKTGAQVVLSKNETEFLNLQARIDRALKSGVNMFVSIHHNALPASFDPFAKPRGFTVYYFNEHSKSLADYIDAAFVQNVKLPNNGVQRGDFYVVRAPQFPAVLTENAFLMFPDQEDMVRQDKTRAAFSQSIFEGILKFYGYAPKDLIPPAPKKPAVKSKKAVPAKGTAKPKPQARKKAAAPKPKPKPQPAKAVSAKPAKYTPPPPADNPYAAPVELQ